MSTVIYSQNHYRLIAVAMLAVEGFDLADCIPPVCGRFAGLIGQFYSRLQALEHMPADGPVLD